MHEAVFGRGEVGCQSAVYGAAEPGREGLGGEGAAKMIAIEESYCCSLVRCVVLWLDE